MAEGNRIMPMFCNECRKGFLIGVHASGERYQVNYCPNCGKTLSHRIEFTKYGEDVETLRGVLK